MHFLFRCSPNPYFQQRGDEFVLLLCGGDKSSQSRDIEAAKKLAFGGMQLGIEKNKQMESILALSISVGHSEYYSPKIVLKEACNLTGGTTGLVVPHEL